MKTTIEIERIDIELIVEVLHDVLREYHESMDHDLFDDVVYALAYFKRLL